MCDLMACLAAQSITHYGSPLPCSSATYTIILPLTSHHHPGVSLTPAFCACLLTGHLCWFLPGFDCFHPKSKQQSKSSDHCHSPGRCVMASEDAHAQEVAVRRVRSTGDIHVLRNPERAHIYDLARHHPSPPTSPPYQTQSNQRAYLDARRSAQVAQPASLYMSNNAAPTTPPPPRQSDNQDRTRPGQPSTDSSLDPFIVKILRFFGVGRRASRERRLLISLIWKLSWGFMQVRHRCPLPKYHCCGAFVYRVFSS